MQGIECCLCPAYTYLVSNNRSHVMSLKETLSDMIDWTIKFTKDLINHSIEAAVSSIKSLWRNAEAVTILTLAGLGVTHFIGVIAVEHAALSILLISEMISPLIAVILIWGLIRLAMARKKYRINHAVA